MCQAEVWPPPGFEVASKFLYIVPWPHDSLPDSSSGECSAAWSRTMGSVLHRQVRRGGLRSPRVREADAAEIAGGPRSRQASLAPAAPAAGAPKGIGGP